MIGRILLLRMEASQFPFVNVSYTNFALVKFARHIFSNIIRFSLELHLPLLIGPDSDWACLLVLENDMDVSFYEV